MGSMTLLGAGKAPAIGGGGSATTWDSATKGANITLSNGDLTATTSSGSRQGVLATTGKSAGKWYFELEMVNLQTFSFGLAQPGHDFFSSPLGKDAAGLSIGFDQSGTVYFDEVLQSTQQFIPNGSSIIGCAVDFDNDKIWFARNNDWMDTTGDPSGGTEGYAMTIAGTCYPALTLSISGASYTARFSSGHTYSPPSGFSLWS